jgi:putative phosphoribosyl transferase
MYFASRLQAGRMLSERIAVKHHGSGYAVVAMDDGGVIVGAQIAKRLHCPITLINSGEINLPLELDAVAGITNDGSLAYNNSYSAGELYEMLTENRGFVEQEKMRKMHELNYLVSGVGTISRPLINDKKIILTSDGLKSGFEIDLAYQFLKPVSIERIIFAVPIANVRVVDRMHILGDEIYCLDIIDEYITTDHYYDRKDVPDHEQVIEIVEELVKKWEG